MIQLVAFDQTYENPHFLDLDNPGAISLNYEIGDIENLVGRNSPYSQTFNLPFTNTNNKFFRQFYNINVDTLAVLSQPLSAFNADLKTNCAIRVDGVSVITGTFQLIKCKKETESYEVVVYGTEANLFQAIEEKKLIDAFRSGDSFTTDYNVNINSTNIINSWDLSNDVTLGTVGNGIIIFPIIDYGYVGDYNFIWLENNPLSNTGLAEPNFLEAQHLKPAIHLNTLFKKIITEAGFTLTNTSFLTSDAFNKAFMTLGTDRETTALTTLHQSQVGNTDNTNIVTWGSGGVDSGSWQQIFFPTQSGAGAGGQPALFYDVSDDWDSNGVYHFPYSGEFYGNLTLTVDSGPASSGNGVTFSVIIASGAYYTQQTFSAPGNDGGGAILTTYSIPFGMYGNAGQDLDIIVLANPGSGVSVNLLAQGTFCTIIGSASLAGVANIPANMPDISQTDFLTDIIQRFNLVVVADETDNKKIRVLPYQDYIDEGERKDWTKKLDLSKERIISPTTKYKKQVIKFSDAEGEDGRNVANQEVYGSVFGNYEQQITGDFLSGTLENKSIFSPFHVNPVPRQDNASLTDAPNLLIHKGYAPGTTGALASDKPKLFYHNGLETLEANDTIYIGGDSVSYYPLCLPYYNAGAQMAVDSPMLYWQYQTPDSWGGVIFGTTPSSEGYFKRYWQQFLMSYYDSQARILDCYLYLTAADIHNFQFNDEIFIEDTNYRVLKIENYQPFSNVPTKVQLLKKINKIPALQIDDSSEDCNASPVTSSANGIVNFEDNETGATVISEVCCQEFHYFWDGTNCFWHYGGGGGGSGDPTTGLGGWNPHGHPSDDTIGGISDLTGVGGFHSRKRSGVPNINPIQGEHSTRGQNVEGFTNSVNKSFVYYATSNSDTPQISTPNGIESEQSNLQIPYNSMARFIVRALSVQTHVLTGGSGSYGSSAFQVWTFLVKNVEGTITVVGGSEQTDFQEKDSDAGTRTIDVVGVAGKTGFAGNRGVNIVCTGPSNSVLSWHLDVEVTYIDIGFTKNLDNLILTENYEYLTTENGNYLEQE